MGTYLWQNFLNNEEVIDFIVQTAKENTDKNLDTIEIWPWKCALTRKLVQLFPNLIVFEKDESFYDILKKCVKEENIKMWDFLSADLEKYIKTDFFNAFWNLPYYITSPIFRKLTRIGKDEKRIGKDNNNQINNEKWSNYQSSKSPKISTSPIMKYWIFMIQKEVGEKIKTDASKKSMLWFLLNFNYNVKYLRTVPAKDFTPPPKVDSCLVSFEYTWNKINWEFEKLEEFLKIMMMYKKKTLWKIQKILQKQWKKFDLPEELLNKRIHELSWEEIEKIEF